MAYTILTCEKCGCLFRQIRDLFGPDDERFIECPACKSKDFYPLPDLCDW